MSFPDWSSADTDQKLEILRDDVRRLFGAVNELAEGIKNIHDVLRRGDPKLNEVAKAVEKIEAHLGISPRKDRRD
jgi:hypothetical protein